MDSYLLDWLNLLLRWAHVITAIAWIGSSFYFVFLDSSLRPAADPKDRERGVSGELWAVHGGGFYHPQKYLVAPPTLPSKLHWFYWESYSTWLTGFALFTVLYLLQAGTYLIDKVVFDWSPLAAGTTALGFLVAFWLVYDLACRAWGQRGRPLVLGAVIAAAAAVFTWAACGLFAGRAAFVLVGAMLATTMSANVLLWIIPGQRAVVCQMQAGLPVDPLHGQRGKQRSLHNTYFTLPVLAAMLSHHYSFLYTAQHRWLVLVLLMMAGALIRHSFVARHRAHVQGQRAPWHWAALGVALLLGIAVWLRPVPPSSRETAAEASPPTLAEVQAIVSQRCVACHNAQLASKGVRLDTAQAIQEHAMQIHQQAVLLRLMPMNNATQITEAERDLLRRWFLHASGAQP